MTKSEEALPIESDDRRETIALSNLLPPPRPIRVIRGYSYTPEFPAAPEGADV